jgi:hypothetical protein
MSLPVANLGSLRSFHLPESRSTVTNYVLDVDVLADGSSLAPGNSRLKVEVHPIFYEDVIVEEAAVVLTALLLVVTGGILLVVSFVKNRRTQHNSQDA